MSLDPDDSLSTLCRDDIQDFIQQNLNADVSDLALKKPPDPEWPYTAILNQIKSRQKAIKKLPELSSIPGILFPEPDVIEQCSSEATATYKASLVSGASFIDLTGGAGIDSFALAKRFKAGHIIECAPDSAAALRHNLSTLKHTHVHVHLGNSEVLIETLPQCDTIFIDPQRRDQSQKGKFDLKQCSPNILDILPKLKKHNAKILLKTSPVLDIHSACIDLRYVQSVHVVGLKNECKELLFLLDPQNSKDIENIPVIAIELSDTGHVHHQLTTTIKSERSLEQSLSKPLKYLYEPYSSFLKSGLFKTIAKQTETYKLHQHAHLYTSEKFNCDFPGRAFEIIGTYKPQKKAGFPAKANLAIRNFPSDVKSLSKKLGITTGGDDFLFATTLMNDEKIVIHCKKKI